MSIAEPPALEPPPATALATGADLLAFLRGIGDVPIERVRLHPTPGTATEADLERVNAGDELCELVDGVLMGKAMSVESSWLATRLGRSLGNFLEEHNLGFLIGADGQARTTRTRVPAATALAAGRGWSRRA